MQVFWFVHLQLLLLITSIVSVAAEGLLFTYDRRGPWMHFTAEGNKTAVKTSLQLPCEAVEIFQRYIEPYKWTWHVWATADRTECAVTEVWWSGNLVSLLMKWERAHRAKSLTAMRRWENNTSRSCVLTHINAYIHTHAHARSDSVHLRLKHKTEKYFRFIVQSLSIIEHTGMLHHNAIMP